MAGMVGVLPRNLFYRKKWNQGGWTLLSDAIWRTLNGAF